MNRLRIKHVTGFHYDGEVTASYNEARMLPVSSDGQLVLYSNIEILPISSNHSYVDYWGTRVSAFEILTPHSELSLSATSLVEVKGTSALPSSLQIIFRNDTPGITPVFGSPRRVLDLNGGERVLEIGCGWGALAERFIRREDRLFLRRVDGK